MSLPDVAMRMRGDLGEEYVAFECPGCSDMHAARVTRGESAGPVWQWNGSLTAPTLNPSVNAVVQYGDDTPRKVCHFYLNAGHVQFLSDSTHGLAGRVVRLRPVLEEPPHES
jgi:hypothetical protein